MPFIIGILLSVGVAILARRAGLDRDRAFYPTVVIVVASYYVLFAAMSGSTSAVLMESIVAAVFIGVAVIGLKSGPGVVAIALIAHGVFDAVHGIAISNPGVPPWWPSFCLAYDVGAGIWLAWMSRSPKLPAMNSRTHAGA